MDELIYIYWTDFGRRAGVHRRTRLALRWNKVVPPEIATCWKNAGRKMI